MMYDVSSTYLLTFLHLSIFLESRSKSTVSTLVAAAAVADTVVAITSSHTVTGASLSTGGLAVLDGIRAVDSSLVTTNTDGTLSGANNRLVTDVKSQLRSIASVLEAESSGASTRRARQSTTETLAALTSTKGLERR